MIMTEIVIGVRDPKGIRLLALGPWTALMCLPPESWFDTIGGEFIRDLRPGEIW